MTPPILALWSVPELNGAARERGACCVVYSRGGGASCFELITRAS